MVQESTLGTLSVQEKFRDLFSVCDENIMTNIITNLVLYDLASNNDKTGNIELIFKNESDIILKFGFQNVTHLLIFNMKIT